jgi:pimeloyl-ACP methyl ester carboxylesterase/predicted glycosyltransferase
MRAALPTESGAVECNGVRVTYEVFGEGDRTIVLMPTWCVVHARIWKMQVPYLSRHFRVITWDGPGNGGADRPPPERADQYAAQAHVEYGLAVLDATSTASGVLVASSGGTHRTLRLAASHADRVDGIVFVGPSTPLSDDHDAEVRAAFVAGDLDGFLDVFMRAAFTEPHSTKPIEDGMGWGRETVMDVLVSSYLADQVGDVDEYREMCARIACPVLVVQGTEDRLTPDSHGRALADAIGANASLVLVEGGGHRTDVRDPVRFSLLLRSFVDRLGPTSPVVAPSRFVRGTHRRPRALYLSSPIGLGHARRDVAIAKELRALRPDLEIDWLAQDPVTRVLDHEGERIHPASEHLVSEAAHIESESAGHDLHCFQAWRRMDETLVANFMVLHDVLDAEHYDLVIGDEAWDADHFLHENPELKRSAFAWLTDFVGWLPVAEGGASEPALTADYNAEMIEHIARYPWVRDRSIFVGNPDDIVTDTFGADLPSIRSWTEEHFDFSGYITGLSPSEVRVDRDELRDALGFQPDELVCIATVGGSSVGTTLLDAVVTAFPLAKAKVPELRMLVVTGPRIDPRSIGELDGLEAVGFVPDLWRHLAACDLAVVQGGLTTAMELTAVGRPFLYFPLLRHFEQQFHVPHRLARYGAGRRMDYATTDREQLASAIVEEVGRPVSYRPVELDGAQRAARLIADLI